MYSGELLWTVWNLFFEYSLFWGQKMTDCEFDVWMVAETIDVQSASEHYSRK